VIISHFHADHISSLKDFTNAQFICHHDAYEQFLKLSGWSAVRKGILHKLFPKNFKNKVILLEDFVEKIEINKQGLIEYSLFGITQFKLLLLPGHARGMLGFIYNYDGKAILYASDASWSYSNYEMGIMPSKIVKIFFDSWVDFVDTQKKLKAFELDNWQYKVLFTHCPQTLKYVDNAF
jgi:glyoxylase-like metal-dependent hydrolase (beta-lactamase superfamily II)